MQCYEFQVPVKLLSGHGCSASSSVAFSWHNLNETAFSLFFGPTQGLNILMVMVCFSQVLVSVPVVYVIFWQEALRESLQGWKSSLEKHANNVLLWIWISAFGKNSNISIILPAQKTFFFFSFIPPFYLLTWNVKHSRGHQSASFRTMITCSFPGW